MADGGEGTLDAFASGIPGARRMPVTVRGPRGRDVQASWLLLPDGTGVVELAGTSGIELLEANLRGWDADTFAALRRDRSLRASRRVRWFRARGWVAHDG